MKKNYFLVSLMLVFISFSGYSQLTAPFVEQFNTTSTPATWNQSNTTGGPWIFTGIMGYNASNITDHTGNPGSTFAWMDFSGTDAGVILESDTIDVAALTIPELNFWFNNHLGANPLSPLNQVYVEVYNDTVWATIDTLQQDNLGIWSEHYYNLAAYVPVSNNIVVRFRAEPGATTSGSAFYQDLALDDISVREFTLCRPPVSLTATAVTAISATARWNAGPAGSTTWSIETGTVGFALGTGTYTNVTVDSLNLTGLSPATQYSFYVRGYCTGSDTSAWAGPYTFLTNCTSDTIPYLMDYNSWAPLCWDLTGGSASWAPYAATTGVAEANFWSNSTGIYFMTSLPVHISERARVTFEWSHLYSTFYPGDSMRVELRIDTSTTWVELWGASGPGLESNDGAGNTVPGSFKEEIINLDSATYVGQNVLLRFVGVSDYGPDLFVDNVNIEKIPTCPKPSLLSNLFVLSDSARFAWVNGLFDSTWQVQYGNSGFALGTGTMKTDTSSGTMGIGGLIPGTIYDLYLRSICTVGDTSKWIGPISFTTVCINDTIPYLMDFNTWPPICWDLNGGVNQWNSYTPFGSTPPGIAEANFWGISSGDFHMTSQPIHVNDVSRLKFDWSHLYNASYPLDSLEVQVKIDTSSTWVKVYGDKGPSFNSNDGAASTAPGSFVNEVVYLDSATYMNQNVLVRFIGVSGFGPDLFIDNMEIEKVPSCPEPTSLSHYLLFFDSVGLSWVDFGRDSIYQVQYGSQGFTLGTGTIINDNNDSTNFGGLSASTSYDVYVRSICKIGDTSVWVGPYTFTTPCSFYTPPYLEDFSTYTFNNNPTCWDEATGVLTVASTLTVGTSGWTNTAFAHNGLGNIAARMNIWSTNKYEWLLSPSIDLGNGSIPYQVEFDVAITDYFNASAPTGQGGLMGSDDKLVLVISPDNGVTWSDTNILEIWDTANMPSFAGDYFYYDLTAAGYTGQVRFGLYAESSISNEDNDAFVDNFAVVQVPTCPRPLKLTFDSATQTTANLSWTNGSNDISWILEYGAPGFTRGTGTQVSSATNPAVINGLVNSTCYDVYLMSICGAGDSSLWIGPTRFCTDCAPVVDLCEGFENYSAGELPICWSSFLSTTGSSTIGINTFGAYQGTNMVRMNSGSDANATMILVSPEMTALGAGTHRASFWLQGSFNPDTTMIIGTMSDPTNPGTFTPWDTIKNVTTAYQFYRIAFDTYTGTDRHVAFLYPATATFKSMSIDEFCFEVIPTCEKAPFVTVLNPGQDSTTIRLGWNIDTSQVSFFTAYGPTGYDPTTNTAGGDTVTTTNNLQIVNGLNSLTEYCFWVKAICTNGDTSAWSGPFCGSTGCPSGVKLPYFEDFTTYQSQFPSDITPQCWEEAIGTLTTSGGLTSMTESNWEPDGFGNIGFNGAARFNISAFGQTEGWLLSPAFDFGPNPNVARIIEFDVALTDDFNSNPAINGFGADDTVALVASYDGGVTWKKADIIMQWDTSNEPSTTGTHIIYTMRNTSGFVKFGFYGLSNIGNEGVDFFVDNFSIRDTTWVGIDEVSFNNSFKVYPNPNNGEFTIQNIGDAQQSSVKLMDIQGRVVYDSEYYFNENGMKQIRVGKLNAGVYLLLLQSDGKLEQHRIVIQ
ncbi:T9SS type A sorting domain-containing protein [Flavobacteriales bacterium]|nr:T9SS type A sorting domain-containing protein [Flavobacteriales bacterium]